MALKRLQNYINGEWVDTQTEEYLEIINPARDDLLCEVPISTKADVDAAVQAAQAAFYDWANTPPLFPGPDISIA